MDGDTKIVMKNGEMKMLRDVVVGDEGMTPSGSFSKVVSTFTMKTTWYKITERTQHKKEGQHKNLNLIGSKYLKLQACSIRGKSEKKSFWTFDPSVYDSMVPLLKTHTHILTNFVRYELNSIRKIMEQHQVPLKYDGVIGWLVRFWLGDSYCNRSQFATDSSYESEFYNWFSYTGSVLNLDVDFVKSKEHQNWNTLLFCGKSDIEGGGPHLNKFNVFLGYPVPFRMLCDEH